MYLRRTVALTPDKSVRWSLISAGNRGTLYLANEAPDISELLLHCHPYEVGPEVGDGRYGIVNKTTDEVYALKESEWVRDMSAKEWHQYCGFGALQLNIALQEGLSRLGENAQLSTGARVRTPTYFGALVMPRIIRVLMSFEQGSHPDETNRQFVGAPEERTELYAEAVRSVGMNPTALAYDDTVGNILVRPEIPEVIKLDACNWQTAHPA